MATFRKRCVLVPREGCVWADKMVLNPAMVADPDAPGTIHMLFRATGPYPQSQGPNTGQGGRRGMRP